MALRDQPYLPLYIQDYLTDEKLNACSAATQGVYIKILCILHKQESYGQLILFKQKDKQNLSMTLNFALKFAKLLTFDTETIHSAIEELVEEKVLTIDGDIITQKRMYHDGRVSELRSTAGKKGGGNPLLFKQNSKQSPKQTDKQNPEYEDEYVNEDVIKDEEEKKGVTGERKTKPKPPEKINFSEFVQMTQKEFETLREEYNEIEVNEIIEILNNYKGSTGKKYKSDYLAIKNWVIDRYNQKHGNNNNQNTGKFGFNHTANGKTTFRNNADQRRDDRQNLTKISLAILQQPDTEKI